MGLLTCTIFSRCPLTPPHTISYLRGWAANRGKPLSVKSPLCAQSTRNPYLQTTQKPFLRYGGGEKRIQHVLLKKEKRIAHTTVHPCHSSSCDQTHDKVLILVRSQTVCPFPQNIVAVQHCSIAFLVFLVLFTTYCFVLSWLAGLPSLLLKSLQFFVLDQIVPSRFLSTYQTTEDVSSDRFRLNIESGSRLSCGEHEFFTNHLVGELDNPRLHNGNHYSKQV